MKVWCDYTCEDESNNWMVSGAEKQNQMNDGKEEKWMFHFFDFILQQRSACQKHLINSGSHEPILTVWNIQFR